MNKTISTKNKVIAFLLASVPFLVGMFSMMMLITFGKEIFNLLVSLSIFLIGCVLLSTYYTAISSKQ